MEHRSTSKGGFSSAIVVAIAFAMLAVALGCASSSRRPSPSLEDIVRMSNEGVSDDDIIALLIETRAVYPLTGSRIIDLHERGVTMEVLNYMQQAYIENERRLERRMYPDPNWGYPCFGCGYHWYRWGGPFYGYPYYYP